MVRMSPWVHKQRPQPTSPLTCIFCSPSRLLAKAGRLVCTTGFFIWGKMESPEIQAWKLVLPTTAGTGDLRASPHLLLEAPVVHLVHAAAGEGLQVLPALAAEEPHVAQALREVAQAFLEISRVLQGQNGENAAGLGPAASIPVTPVKLMHPHAVNGSSGQSQPSPWGFLDAHPGHRTYRAAAPPTAPRRSCTPWKAKGRRQRDPELALRCVGGRGGSCSTHRYVALRLESLRRLSWRVRFMDGGRFPGVSMNWTKWEENKRVRCR